MVPASMRMLPPAPVPRLLFSSPFDRTLPSRVKEPALMRAMPPPGLHGLQVPFE
jgi:hypothetical protein